MTNEQQVIYLTELKIQLTRALIDGQNTLIKEYPGVISIFRTARTNCFKPLKEIIANIEKQIEILSPSFP